VISIHLLNFIERWKIGSFRLEKGWFGIPYKMSYPMEATMQKLFNSRQRGGLAEKIAKRMAAGYWGLTKQTKSDGTFGDYFMPVWNADIADRCTVRVAEFIYRNKIHPIHIGVDGILCQKKIELGENGFGKWRLSGTEPTLVVASGKLWQGSKHPGGMYYEEIMELIKRRPNDREYIRNYKETITLGMAANTDWRLLGKTEEVSSRVNIDMPRDRVFIPHPETGKDILEKKWVSRPLTVHEEESL
jgi:hypothetical protein